VILTIDTAITVNEYIENTLKYPPVFFRQLNGYPNGWKWWKHKHSRQRSHYHI